MNRMDGESNENVYRKLGMSSRGEGMSCGVAMKEETKDDEDRENLDERQKRVKNKHNERRKK